MNPIVVLGFIAVLIVCWFGHVKHEDNEALILRCGGTPEHDRVLTATWDGGTLIAVHCDNGRSFHR